MSDNLNSNDLSIVGSTLTPTTTISPVIDTNNIRSQQLILSGTQVSGVSSDHSETDEKKLATIFAVSQAAAELHKALSALGDDVADIYLSPVLSPPIASPTFSNLNQWDIGNFIIDAGKAIFISRESGVEKQATLRLLTEVFHKPGTHYLDIEIDSLPTGATLTIINEKSEIIKVINTGGRSRLEFNVENPGITYLEFIAGLVPQGYSLMISYLGVHYVKTEFESYMEYMAGKMLSGGSGFASLDDVNKAIAALDKSLKEYINLTLSGNLDALQSHVNDTTGNPHAINCELIKAAKEIHKHGLADILGLTDALSPVAVCVENLRMLTLTIQEHFVEDNPHGISVDSIQAARAVHNHPITDIVELDIALNKLKDELEISLLDKIVAVNERMNEISLNVQDLGKNLMEHTTENGNVHDAIPKDFGIIHATTAEAISGSDANLYMSPKTTKAQLESWATLPNVDITKLCPKYQGKFRLRSDILNVTIPVTLGVNYQIVLTGLYQYDLRKVILTLNGAISSVISTPTITTTLQQDTGIITKQQNCPGLKFLPDGIGYTTMYGNYQLNTTHGSLIGRGVGYVIDDQFKPIGTTMDMVNVISAYNVPIRVDSMESITFTIDSMVPNAEIGIEIYELISAPDIPIIVDAHKAGTIIRKFGSAPLQDYSLFDGSVLNRSTFLDLWNEANASGTVLSKSEWDDVVASTGYCESFHNGNGTTTFGLPKFQISVNKINDYIKLKNTFLPSPAQLITQYVWN